MRTRPGLLIGVLLGGFCAVMAGSPPPAALRVQSADTLSGIVVNITVHSPALAANLLARLRAIAFDVGSHDENHDIRAGARDFDAGLTRNGIAHQFEEYEGTHMSRIGERLETRVLPFFSRTLALDKPDSQPKAKKGEQ